MKEFKYIINDPAGIHARPAGILVKQANAFKSKITILKEEKKGDLKRIFSIMALGVKQGQEITIQVEGEDEELASTTILQALKDNF